LETDEEEARRGMRVNQESAPSCDDDEQSATSGQPGTDEAGCRPERGRRDDAGGLDEGLTAILESLLFAAGEPVGLAQLANALEDVPRERIRKTLSEMAIAYASGGRGFVLEEIAGGYQLRTPSKHAVYVRRLLSAKPPRLSRPLLETLAIGAYRQPITRPEIEQLRGVDSGAVLETLIERNLIKIAGRKDAPGRPIMYTTTPDFLELFGLKALESLPDLEEFRELEGLRDPVEVAQTQPLADFAQSTTSLSPAQPESAEQSLWNEPQSRPQVAETDEILRPASGSNTARSGASMSSAEIDRRTGAENSNEPKEPR
jgi:segregation and condensation protein B